MRPAPEMQPTMVAAEHALTLYSRFLQQSVGCARRMTENGEQGRLATPLPARQADSNLLRLIARSATRTYDRQSWSGSATSATLARTAEGVSSVAVTVSFASWCLLGRGLSPL